MIGVIPIEYYPASNRVKRKYVGRSFNISHDRVMRMFL